MLGVLSRWNGTIDLEVAARQGIGGVILKALEGDTLDPMFTINAGEAKAVGMPWSPGVKPDMARDDMEKQADRFWQTVHAWEPQLVPSIDWDGAGWSTTPDPDVLLPRMLRFHRWLTQLADAVPMIYTLDNFWNAHVYPAFKGHPNPFVAPLRSADYRDSFGVPPDPAEWATWLAQLPPPENQPDRVSGWPAWDADPDAGLAVLGEQRARP